SLPSLAARTAASVAASSIDLPQPASVASTVAASATVISGRRTGMGLVVVDIAGLEVSPARTGIAANANARPPGTPVAQDAGQEMCLRMRQDAGDDASSARRPAFSRVPSARKYVRSSRQAGKRASTAAQNAGE